LYKKEKEKNIILKQIKMVKDVLKNWHSKYNRTNYNKFYETLINETHNVVANLLFICYRIINRINTYRYNYKYNLHFRCVCVYIYIYFFLYAFLYLYAFLIPHFYSNFLIGFLKFCIKFDIYSDLCILTKLTKLIFRKW